MLAHEVILTLSIQTHLVFVLFCELFALVCNPFAGPYGEYLRCALIHISLNRMCYSHFLTVNRQFQDQFLV